MARSFRRKHSLDAVSEINVTPLIDLAFALLIIFMITAPLLEQTIRINLPEESQKSMTAEKAEKHYTISINQKGDYFWNEQDVQPLELSTIIQDKANSTEDPIIHLRADSRIDYQQVINVIDLLKQHNLKKISLDTKVM